MVGGLGGDGSGSRTLNRARGARSPRRVWQRVGGCLRPGWEAGPASWLTRAQCACTGAVGLRENRSSGFQEDAVGVRLEGCLRSP